MRVASEAAARAAVYVAQTGSKDPVDVAYAFEVAANETIIAGEDAHKSQSLIDFFSSPNVTLDAIKISSRAIASLLKPTKHEAMKVAERAKRKMALAKYSAIGEAIGGGYAAGYIGVEIWPNTKKIAGLV